MKDFDPGLNFKKSNIRIWIHQRNLANLQQVVWEGHGSKLLVEHSNNHKIKKFLDGVPHIMVRVVTSSKCCSILQYFLYFLGSH